MKAKPETTFMVQGRSNGAHYVEYIEPIAFNVATATFVAGVGRTTLFEAIKAGELKSFRHCGRRLIMRDDLFDWLRASRDAA